MSAHDYRSTLPTPGSDPTGPADSATDLPTTAKEDLSRVGDEVAHQAAALGEEAKSKVEGMAEKAKGMAGEQKELVARHLGAISEALQNAASTLEGKDEGSAHYVRLIADAAEDLTASVRDNDVDDIVTIAQDFGRKQPAAFLGAAALLGFAASRFVAASASRPRETPTSASSTSVASTPMSGNHAEIQGRA